MATDSRAPIDPYANAAQVPFQFWAKPVLQNPDGSYYTPGFDGATYAKSPWDSVIIAVPFNPPLEQPKTPGVCRVRVKKYRDVDKKKQAGTDGARVTIHGVEPSSVEIEITIWTPEQLRRLADLWAVLFPKATKGSPQAFDVMHPMFTIHDIRSLQFVEGEGPIIDQQRKGTFTMRAIEYRPPSSKKASKTETQSIGSLLDPTTTNHPTPSNTGP